ncbi:exonuclease SbcCD subunit D [Candidatus Berkelbacteria bacterium]|nr:exonuclease SbcCD subunit D [Candidatus Berkelbacteria bacterium]
MKFIHFADVHLGMENYGRLDPKTGLSSRLFDFCRCFDFLVDYAIENKVDAALFAGDAYKTRDPSPTYQRAFAQRIKKMAEAGIPVVMIPGNHDLPLAMGKAHTLEIFSTLKIPNVYILSQPEILKIPNLPLQIVALPWLSRQQLLAKEEDLKLTAEKTQELLKEKLNQTVKELIIKLSPDTPAVLLAHSAVESAQYGAERNITVGSDIPLGLELLVHSPFSYIGLGHIHKHQVLKEKPPIVYSGSIERIDFSEEKEDKGFVVVEIEKNAPARWQFIKVPARSFKTITVKVGEQDIDPTATVVGRVQQENIAETVVRLIIHTPLSKVGEIRETPIRESLSDAFFIASINKEVENKEEVKTIEVFSDNLMEKTTTDWVREYLKLKSKSPRETEKLMKITEDLLESNQFND